MNYVIRTQIEKSIDDLHKSGRLNTHLEKLKHPYFLRFFKILLLKRYYSLSDELLYNLLEDRISFRSFIGIAHPEEIPAIATIQDFRNSIGEHTLFQLFEELDLLLFKDGMRIKRGNTTELEAIASIHTQDGDITNISSSQEELISCVYLPPLTYPLHLRSNTSDFRVYSEVFNREVYKIDIDFEPDFIIDCGANIGLASIYFRSRFPQSQIVAIEPESSNFILLDRNLSYYFPLIKCIQGAVWNKSTNLSISHGPCGEKWGFMVNEIHSPDKQEQITRSYTIEDIMKMCNKDYIDILKIDIEGAEKELFEKNTSWLKNTKIILIELHDRLKNGCSDSFFNAISGFNFTVSRRAETIICIKAG